MFQFRRFPSYTYLIQYRIPCGGFPHSDISGSQLICSSPKLFAAYHVLHRLLMPRHSPCALISLTYSVFLEISPIIGSLKNYAGSILSEDFLFSKNCNFYPKKIIYPLLLPSHNCIIITMFSFQGAFEFLKKLIETSVITEISINFQRNGGEYRDRTGDLLLARQALSQLS